MNQPIKILIVGVSVLAAAGCSVLPKPVAPKQAASPKFEREWKDVKVTRDHQIVDVHTHLFNARYLPLKRIAQARRFGKGWWWIPSPLVDTAIALVKSSSPKDATMDRDAELKAALKTEHPTSAQRVKYMLDHPVEKFTGSFRGLLEGDGEAWLAGPIGNVLYAVGLRQWTVGLLAQAFLDGEAHAHDESGEMIPRFSVRLMSSEKELWKRLQEDHPRVDRFVYQMMDMVPSYYTQKPGISILSARKGKPPEAYSVGTSRRSATSAITRTLELCRQSGGKMDFFVAWNPFRSFRGLDGKDANRGSLEIVKAAIASGAKGVKFYPPLGYRASGNNFEDVPVPRFLGIVPTEATRQWEARYMTIPKPGERSVVQNGEALDALNEKLFDWCEKNGVPIFAHCNMGEFRAYEDKAYADMANPKWWGPVLRKHRNLKLCLGHAGGPADWYQGRAQWNPAFTAQEAKEWGETVRQLCLDYPNVYCEFGCHDAVGHVEKAEGLYRTLVAELPRRGAGNWTLGDKVLYGSDWFMPGDVTPKTYLESFERLFSLPKLSGYKSRFFAGNALKYLNGGKRTKSR